MIMLITMLSIVCPKKDLSVDELSIGVVFYKKLAVYAVQKGELNEKSNN